MAVEPARRSVDNFKDDVREGTVITVRTNPTPNQTYRLYKWRFPGVIGLVFLNIVGGLNWPWFGSISAEVSEDFQISVDKVNWLGNIANLMFLPGAMITPFLCKRFGVRGCCVTGEIFLILGAWIRFAGTARSLSPGGAYALLFIGQMLTGLAQPVFQVIAPRYSEAWFSFDGRTTATMIISIANPVGSALGQLLPSLLGSTRHSILILGIICTAVAPVIFLVRSQPPTPPTYSGAIPLPPPISTIRSVINYRKPGDRALTLRTRVDFGIILFAFGMFVAAANSFSILTAQIFGPYGYSATSSGLFGAVLILSGLVAAIVSAPLFDRVFTTYITPLVKIFVALLGLSWLGLIWDVRENNAGGIFALMAVIGITSLTLLPITLEIACELIRDSDTSSAMLWFTANLMGVVFVLVGNALTAGKDATPPLNLRRHTIFVAVMTCTAAALVVTCFRGLPDSRRSLDKAKQHEAMGSNDQSPDSINSPDSGSSSERKDELA